MDIIRQKLCIILGLMIVLSWSANAFQVEKSVDKAKELGQSIADQTKIEPVEYEDLKDLMPKKLKKMQRVDIFGENSSMLGVKTANARAEYEGKKDQHVKIKITDMGTIKSLASFAMAAWVAADIEKESDDGFERTIDYKGHKAFTKYSKSKQRGEYKVLVSGRFLVEVEGDNVDMKQVEKAIDEINIKKLEKIKDRGVPN